MSKTVNLEGTMAPTGADVEVEVKIHTRLNISSYVAQQKANVALALHCGQSFCIEEPILQVGSQITWLVPVWLVPPTHGKKTKLGEFVIDAQTGEVLEAGERCRTFKQIANTLLQPAPAADPDSD
jgi:hypothetical protein